MLGHQVRSTCTNKDQHRSQLQLGIFTHLVFGSQSNLALISTSKDQDIDEDEHTHGHTYHTMPFWRMGRQLGS